MSAPRISAALFAVTLTLAVGCGDDDTTTTNASTSSSSTSSATSTTQPTADQQPAIWPTVGIVFNTPEEAAQDFVTEVLGAGKLGEFQQGDSRSGEIDVSSAPNEGGRSVVRSRLLLRQLGDRWFILAAVNDNASITAPKAGAEVAAGPVTVEGKARGFEANVVVSAFAGGDPDPRLDQVITQGGAMETPLPFTVSLDLSGAPPGQTVTIIVRGGTGLETDPGEFSAIPVIIAG